MNYMFGVLVALSCLSASFADESNEGLTIKNWMCEVAGKFAQIIVDQDAPNNLVKCAYFQGLKFLDLIQCDGEKFCTKMPNPCGQKNDDTPPKTDDGGKQDDGTGDNPGADQKSKSSKKSKALHSTKSRQAKTNGASKKSKHLNKAKSQSKRRNPRPSNLKK